MNPYIQSLRLRTLPLSMSGIILGAGLAGWLNWPVFALAICTTLSLQILSNLSNELGDAQKGTDTDQHGRAAYGLQAGTITVPQMKAMIGVFVFLSVLFGTSLIYCAFGTLAGPKSLLFFLLGLLAIIGAMTYTLGRHSYGYMGLGDLGVFIFFGLVSTLGSFYLQVQYMTWETICCGIAIGLPCVGVLNLNNIRDMNNDRAHGKRTLASALGIRASKVYHTLLLVLCLSLFVLFGHYWVLIVAPLWAWHLWYIWTHEGSALDRQMPILMLSTLVVAALGWL
jgi:1,4-dihydroxy-2-naphthoate octaprenyltransferase